MTLVQAWIDSVQLLRPKNFKLFIMVTLKSIIEAYKLLFKYFWWLILLLLIFYGCVIGNLYFFALIVVIQSLLFFMVCSITRPSVAKKNCAYFRSQLYPFMYIIIFQLVLGGISYFIPDALMISVKSLTSFLYFPWLTLLILFFLDSEKNIKKFFISMWHAVKMIVFNFPIIVCFYIAIYVFDIGILWFFEKCVELLFQLFIWVGVRSRMLLYINYLMGITPSLLLPIGICTYANIYIKKLHDQFDLYVKQPQ